MVDEEVEMEKLFNEMIEEAIIQSASDIHFIPNDKSTSIKFRIHGDIEDYREIDYMLFRKLLSYIKFTAHLDVSEKNKAQSGIIHFNLKDLRYNIRASTLPRALGDEACVLRIIRQNFIDEYQTDDKILFNQIKKSNGIIIISGPTGSGKSTLMYQLVHYARNTLKRQIISIEDPVEQHIEGIIQVNVNEKAEITYHTAIKAILRCDPDIIMLGEIRDSVVAQQVINAGLSGHLVLTTLHANDCIGALFRLKEMGINTVDLYQSINLIINQRLVRKKDGKGRLLAYEFLTKKDIEKYLHGEHINYRTLTEQFKELYETNQISHNEFEKFNL